MCSVSLAAKARTAIALAIFGSVCVAQAVLAQNNVTIDAEKCAKLTSPADRLDCYERQVDAASAQKQAVTPASSASTAPKPTGPDTRSAGAAPVAAAPAAAAASAESAHATPSNVADATKSAPAAQAPVNKNLASSTSTAPQEIVGTVTALRTTVPNAWLITLDNGQVWRQTYPQEYLLSPGQRVTLRPSRWGGAFRLTAEKAKGFIQVEQVR
jgi:hypothetical protein